MDDVIFESEAFALVRRGDRVQVVASGSVLLDGRTCGGRIEARLVPESGVDSDVVLSGVDGGGKLQLIGRGILGLGAFTLRDATATLDETGLSVTGSLDWSKEPAAARFEMNGSSGTWHAQLDGRETLQCLMTSAEVLRTSIVIDFARDGQPVSSTALAVLDGRNIEVPLGEQALTIRQGSLSGARAAVLAAVAAYVNDELRTIAASYAAALADGDESQRGTWPDLPSALDGTERLKGWNGDTVPAAHIGYLSTAAPRIRSDAAGAPQPRGYLPFGAASGGPGGRGYLDAAPRIKPQHSGYLPAVAGDGVDGGTRHAFAGPPVAAGSRANTGRPAANSIEVERLGLALLRCKDLLAALESTAANNSGDHER